MMTFCKLTAAINTLLIMLFVYLGVNTLAYGAIISTEDIINGKLTNQIDYLHSSFVRERLSQQLIEMGVDQKEAVIRAESMTDREIQSLISGLQDVPAGGDVLVVAAMIFVVLLYTDIMGYTDIFPFVNKGAPPTQKRKREKQQAPVREN